MAVGVRTKDVGKQIKAYRERVGLKQNDLGQRLGHKTGAKVSAWEAGTVLPSLELTAEVAAQLGVTTSHLLGEAPLPESGTQITNNVVNGDHHIVYQTVQGGVLLMTDEFQQVLRAIVEEVVDARCERLVEEFRAVLSERDAAREADADPGEGEP
jgi:DNA-binding XRE family transcriptional regulator